MVKRIPNSAHGRAGVHNVVPELPTWLRQRRPARDGARHEDWHHGAQWWHVVAQSRQLLVANV